MTSPDIRTDDFGRIIAVSHADTSPYKRVLRSSPIAFFAPTVVCLIALQAGVLVARFTASKSIAVISAVGIAAVLVIIALSIITTIGVFKRTESDITDTEKRLVLVSDVPLAHYIQHTGASADQVCVMIQQASASESGREVIERLAAINAFPAPDREGMVEAINSKTIELLDSLLTV